MRVVVDADYLVYACGYAVERNRFDVSVQRPDGTTDEACLNTRDEAMAWLSDEPEGSVKQLDVLVDAEPLANALFLVNRTLTSVDQNLTQAGIEFDRLELYITGKGNFRDRIATIKGYKANRDPSRKPVHYRSIRRYLRNRYGAVEVNGYEADDAVAMIAAEEHFDPARLVIVSVDKDLLTIPGRHYNFKSKKFSIVTPDAALVNFYRQMVTGDTVDNIGGVYKSGPKAALAITAEMTEQGMYNKVLDLFIASMEKKGCPYGNMSAEAALLENARLLHLRRYPEEEWVPPSDRSSTGPSSSAGSGTGWTEKKSPTGTSPEPSLSLSRSPVAAVIAALGPSSGTPSTPQTSSSASG